MKNKINQLEKLRKLKGKKIVNYNKHVTSYTTNNIKDCLEIYLNCKRQSNYAFFKKIQDNCKNNK